MKSANISLVKWLFTFLYFVFIYIYLSSVILPKLQYHIQQPAFISTLGFFQQYLTGPGKLSEYISNFLNQFFFLNWSGSLIILIVAGLLMRLGVAIFRTFQNTGNGYLWMFLPVAFMVAQFNNYFFPFVIAIRVIILYLAFWIFLFSLKRNTLYYIQYFFIGICTYYIAGSGSFMVFSACAIIMVFYNKNLKNGLIFLLSGLVFSLIIPFVAYKFLFNITLKGAYFQIYPDLPTILKYEPNSLLYIFYFYLPAAIILLSIISEIFKWIQEKSLSNDLTNPALKSNLAVIKNLIIKPYNISKKYLTKWYMLLISFLIIIGITWVSLNSTENKHRKNIVLADYYNYHEKWDKVIDVVLSDKKYDFYLNYYYTRAIDQMGYFVDSIFNYPQYLGPDGLFPDRLETVSLILISSDFYYDLGYISQAHHWAHEAMTEMPYSPRIMQRLTLTNLIFGNYKAANNLLSIMNNMFFQKEFVNKYMRYINDTNLIYSDKLIMEKRAYLPIKTVVLSSYPTRMHDLLASNHKNKRAMEHLEMYYLLNGSLNEFNNNLPELLKFYQKTPYVFEQAILAYLYGNKQKSLSDYNVSIQSQEVFENFNEILFKYNGHRKLAKPELNKLYKNTYLYYLLFNSPRVTKASLKIK